MFSTLAKNATIPEGSASTPCPELSTSMPSTQLEDTSSNSPLLRPSRSSKPTPKVIAAFENTFTDSNIETGMYIHILFKLKYGFFKR